MDAVFPKDPIFRLIILTLVKVKKRTNGSVNAHLTISQNNHNCEMRKRGNIDFLDAQEQLTLWSLSRYGPISNSSKLLCMSSLPASMKRI